MATLDIRVSCEMTKPVPVRHIDGMVFSQDVMGNRVLVSMLRDGVPESPGGAITANIVRSDGTTVVQNGTISGNLASVVLPASAYAVPGSIGIFVKHTSSGATSTIAALTGYVYRSTTDTIVDPGTVIPNINQLLALVEDCESAANVATAAASSANTAAETAIAAAQSVVDAISVSGTTLVIDI